MAGAVSQNPYDQMYNTYWDNRYHGGATSNACEMLTPDIEKKYQDQNRTPEALGQCYIDMAKLSKVHWGVPDDVRARQAQQH